MIRPNKLPNILQGLSQQLKRTIFTKKRENYDDHIEPGFRKTQDKKIRQ